MDNYLLWFGDCGCYWVKRIEYCWKFKIFVIDCIVILEMNDMLSLFCVFCCCVKEYVCFIGRNKFGINLLLNI